MGGSQSNVEEEKTEADPKEEDGFIFKKILLSGSRCSGKFSLYSTVRWIYRNKAFETRVSWKRHRHHSVTQLIRDVLQTLDANRDFIQADPKHSAEQLKLSKQIEIMRNYIQKDDTLEKDEEIDEQLTLVVTALKELWFGWSEMNTELWNRHWGRYFVNPHSEWFLNKLNDTEQFGYLTDEDPSKNGLFESYIRGYQSGRDASRWDVFVDKAEVLSDGVMLSMIVDCWMRKEKVVCSDDDSKSVSNLMTDTIVGYHGGIENPLIRRIARDKPGYVYEWVYFPGGSPMKGDWLEDVPAADFFVHVTSLVGFATQMDDDSHHQSVMEKDLGLFRQLVSEGRVYDSSQDKDVVGSMPRANLKSEARCVLVFSNRDTLRNMIEKGHFNRTSDLVRLSDYIGPRFDDEHPDCPDSDWLDVCVDGVTNHVISQYLAVPGFEDFVLKVITLDPTDVSEVSEKMLNKQLFRMIDRVGSTEEDIQ